MSLHSQIFKPFNEINSQSVLHFVIPFHDISSSLCAGKYLMIFRRSKGCLRLQIYSMMVLSFKVLEMRKTPLFAARYYLHYLHSFTFIHIPSLQRSNIFCFFQSLHNFSLTQFSSCLSSIQFSFCQFIQYTM